jgi:hypothetical protein
VASVFGPGDYIVSDPEHGLQVAAAPNPRADVSISKLMKLDVSVPDFSTLSRRGKGLHLPAKPAAKRTDSVHLVVDSTGLKIFGEGEWLQKKHKTKAKRKQWRNLRLGLNLATGNIICAALTLDSVGDTTALLLAYFAMAGPEYPARYHRR